MGPDLYHFNYIDLQAIAGVAPPDTQSASITLRNFSVNPDGSLSTFNTPVTFNFSSERKQLVKPANFTVRQAPGEINVLADTLEEMAVRIRDRTSNMEAALAARDAAMKEIHHRVKNNLQIINSLLSLQSRKLKDPAAVAVLDDARARINALSLIHRSLYEHNDVRTVETRIFFTELTGQLDQALGAEDQGIRIVAAIDDDTIDADVAVPLALFTAEAVTNAVKHAFPEGGRTRSG